VQKQHEFDPNLPPETDRLRFHMPALGPEQWKALSPYLDQALEVPPDQRGAWLDTLKRENPSLAGDLLLLLKEHRALDVEGFLQTAPGTPIHPPSLVGQTVGAYTLVSPIGQGGMGTVWLARRSDSRFEGRAAVKFLNVALLGRGGEARFKREGSILASLAHPNIAHLLDAGVTATGQPYLVLEYLEGAHLDAYCREHALDLEARLRLFLEVTAAVTHAHANLIVHRDIKPSNVLVTNDGHVKLLDFGIAKLLEDDAPASVATALTREGGTALTLAFAAPEQLTGRAITTGTDIYALGVLLYLLVTEKHPAESSLHSQADLIKAIVEIEPPTASDAVASTPKLRGALQGDVDTIIAKALKKNPAERYLSVTAFSEDLRRYLRHETISARPDTLVYRARKFVARNRTAVALAAAALIATMAGIVSTLFQARTARIERDFALRQLSRAETINDLNSFVLSDAAPSGKPFTVNDLLARAEQLVGRQPGAVDANRVELLLSIGRQYMDQGEQVKARQLLTQAYSLAQALPEPSTRARTSCALAKALVEIDLSRAERLFEEGFGELPQDDRFALDRVVCLQFGGELALRAGHSQDAIARARRAQRELHQAPFQSRVFELDTLVLLASAYRHANLLQESNAAFAQASAGLTALGRDNTDRASKLFTDWGLALWEWGRPLEAERLLRRAISISQDNRAEATVHPSLLVHYARALKDLGRLDEAADYAERASAKAETSGDHLALNQSLLVRQVIYRLQGKLERATETLSRVESALRPRLPPGHIAFASFAWNWGLIAQARGNTQAALGLVNQAVASAEAAINEGREGAGYLELFLMSRSEIQLKLGHPEEAASDAKRAVTRLAANQPPGTFSVILGRADVALGRALLAQGKREEARSAFRSGADHIQNTLGPDHAEARDAQKLLDQQT
jgi:eukaryotic-like serine/threonine-protein kinase